MGDHVPASADVFHVSSIPQTAPDLSKIIARLQNCMERERVVLSRSLHDDLGALLVAAVMDLGWIQQRQIGLLPSVDSERLERVRGSVEAAIHLKRRLIEDLRPSLLDNLGLFAAMRWQMKRACDKVGVRYQEDYPDQELNLQPMALAGLFRIAEETMTMFLAEPSLESVTVRLGVSDDILVLAMSHAHMVPESIDLFEQRSLELGVLLQRIAHLGGNLDVECAAAGTALRVQFPLAHLLATAR